MQNVSMEQVAQLLQSVSAARPTELALQNDNRRLNEEVQSLQAQLRQSGSAVEATAKAFNERQASHMRVTSAYTALKRNDMMDMIAMFRDYLPEGMPAGSEEYIAKAKQLTHDVTVMHDDSLNSGVGCDVVL